MLAVILQSMRRRSLAAITLVPYLVYLLACAALTLLDPPWGKRGGYDGILGALASFAAGLPWSFFVLDALAGGALPRMSEAMTAAVLWAGALFNLGLFGIPLGFWRAVSDFCRGMRAEIARLRPPAPPSIAPPADLRERMQSTAERFDARRKEPQLRLLCVVAALMVLAWMVLPQGEAPQDGAAPERAPASMVVLSLVLLAVAGTACRHLCGNARLQGSRALYLLAMSGTASGTLLGLAGVMMFAGTVPLLAAVIALFAGWQGWLFAASVGTRLARAARE